MGIDKSVINRISLEFSVLARNKNHDGAEILSLGLGEPGFPTPKKIIDAAYKSMLKGENKYASPWGTPELLNKIRKNIESNSITIGPQELIITIGSKQALSLCLTSILEELDEIIIISPCYVSYKPQIKMAEKLAVIKEVSLDKSTLKINFKKLQKTISSKTKAILINSPHNPTGSVLTKNEIERLVKLSIENNIYIISDEIYSSMTFKKNSFISLLEYRRKYEKIFVINGFSKCFSMTGWRIGYLIGPSDHIKRVSVLQQHLNTNVPVFIQRGAEAALDLPKTFINNYKAHLISNSKFLKKKISSNKFLSCKITEGGMFAMINISRLNENSDLFSTKLLKVTNVAVTPGIVFSKDWNDHIRVSIAGDKSQFKEAINRLIKYVNAKNNKK